MSQEKLKWQSDEMREIATQKFNKVVNDKLKKELEDNVRDLAEQVAKEVFQVNHNTTSHITTNHNNNHFQHKSSVQHNGGHNHTLKTHGKVFIARDSLLTELLEVSHIRTIYHIFIVILIILFLNTVIYDLVDRGSINVGINIVFSGFGRFYHVVWIWAIMQVSALTVYPLLDFWAQTRNYYLQSKSLVKVWDVTWLCLLTVFQLTLITLAVMSLFKYNIPVVSSMVVLLESIRFAMKIHAFVRSIVPRVLNKTSLPSFSCYLYFLFAPTLVYRDSYPRTNHTRWGVVAARLLEIVAIIFYMSFLFERFFRSISNFGKHDQVMEAKQFVVIVFSSMLPALLSYLCGFYLLLHSWHNATSEIFTFADRLFYMDWWNQWSYASFYRTWNMIVHDWLHTYIYRDILMLTGNRLLGTLSVFTISAIFHEIVLGFSFGFFYPIMLVMFGFLGVLLIFLTRHINKYAGNIFMWWSLAVGNGLMWSLYGMEYFARQNCPTLEYTNFWEQLIPRSWTCHGIQLHPDWKFQNPLAD